MLTAAGWVTIRATVDGFHHARAHRYRRGQHAWEGFWLDAFDVEQLRSELLDPLKESGSGRYRRAVHDLATDQSLDLPYEVAPPGAVLLLDGVFSHRDEPSSAGISPSSSRSPSVSASSAWPRVTAPIQTRTRRACPGTC